MLLKIIGLLIFGAYVVGFSLLAVSGRESRREEAEEFQRWLTEQRTDSKPD